MKIESADLTVSVQRLKAIAIDQVKRYGEIKMVQMRRPEDVVSGFQAAWNTHDMEALGLLFCPDASFVNRFGHYVKGVEAIVGMHAPIHQTIYSDSTIANELIDAVFLSDDAAILHFWSRLTTGKAHPTGPHSVDTLIQAVLLRQNQEWKIKALENVTLTNPRTGEIVLREAKS